jgi:hypothetical protein
MWLLKALISLNKKNDVDFWDMMAVARTNVSKEHIASFFRVTRL